MQCNSSPTQWGVFGPNNQPGCCHLVDPTLTKLTPSYDCIGSSDDSAQVWLVFTPTNTTPLDCEHYSFDYHF